MSYPNKELMDGCRKLLDALPARLPNRKMQGRDPRWTPRLTQRDVDIIYAALSHHEYYARFGHHEDVDVGDLPRRLAANIYREDATEEEAQNYHRIWDPYAHIPNAKMRKFIMEMDVHTLEEVIVRVMCELWRRREKYLGGDVKVAKRHFDALQAKGEMG